MSKLTLCKTISKTLSVHTNVGGIGKNVLFFTTINDFYHDVLKSRCYWIIAWF